MDNFNRRIRSQNLVEHPGTEPTDVFRYFDHVRTYPTVIFGGVEGSHVSTVAFIRKWHPNFTIKVKYPMGWRNPMCLTVAFSLLVAIKPFSYCHLFPLLDLDNVFVTPMRYFYVLGWGLKKFLLYVCFKYIAIFQNFLLLNNFSTNFTNPQHKDQKHTWFIDTIYGSDQ